MDIDLYTPTNKTIRENKQKMYEAFAEISGLGKANVESMNLVYGDGGKLFEYPFPHETSPHLSPGV